MRIEKVSPAVVNQLFRPTKIQAILEEFMSSEEIAVRCILDEGEYRNIKSAHSSYSTAIRRLKYPIRVRVLNGDIYLIKVRQKEQQ